MEETRPAYPGGDRVLCSRRHVSVGWPCLRLGRRRVKGPKSPMAAGTLGSSPDDRHPALSAGAGDRPNSQHSAKLLPAPTSHCSSFSSHRGQITASLLHKVNQSASWTGPVTSPG
ncbi:hypothetical protein Bbelb_011520 [Branchiostoma belcheri]|nr:hypothetical protein Bbelb_011520 [Branchiostoma belcheri]